MGNNIEQTVGGKRRYQQQLLAIEDGTHELRQSVRTTSPGIEAARGNIPGYVGLIINGKRNNVGTTPEMITSMTPNIITRIDEATLWLVANEDNANARDLQFLVGGVGIDDLGLLRWQTAFVSTHPSDATTPVDITSFVLPDTRALPASPILDKTWTAYLNDFLIFDLTGRVPDITTAFYLVTTDSPTSPPAENTIAGQINAGQHQMLSSAFAGADNYAPSGYIISTGARDKPVSAEFIGRVTGQLTNTIVLDIETSGSFAIDLLGRSSSGTLAIEGFTLATAETGTVSSVDSIVVIAFEPVI